MVMRPHPVIGAVMRMGFVINGRTERMVMVLHHIRAPVSPRPYLMMVIHSRRWRRWAVIPLAMMIMLAVRVVVTPMHLRDKP